MKGQEDIHWSLNMEKTQILNKYRYLLLSPTHKKLETHGYSGRIKETKKVIIGLSRQRGGQSSQCSS